MLLALPHPRIDTPLSQQFIMSPAFHNLPSGEHQNFVSMYHRGQAMRDQQRSNAVRHSFDILLDKMLGLAIQR